MKILYKIVTPILTALIFPVIVFMPFFRLITASDTVNQLLTKYGIGEQITLLDLYHAVSNIKTQAAADGKTLNLSLDVIPEQARGYLIAFLVFFFLAILCAVLIIILSPILKKKLPVAGISIFGALSAFLMNVFFNKAAHGFISGKINVIDIYTAVTGDTSVSTLTGLVGNILGAVSGESNQLGGILNSLLGGYTGVDIRILELSSAQTFMLLIFGAVTVFTVIMKLVQTDN